MSEADDIKRKLAEIRSRIAKTNESIEKVRAKFAPERTDEKKPRKPAPRKPRD